MKQTVAKFIRRAFLPVGVVALLVGCEGVNRVGPDYTALETELTGLREDYDALRTEFDTFREEWGTFNDEWGTFRDDWGVFRGEEVGVAE
jgi:hypothetical protein